MVRIVVQLTEEQTRSLKRLGADRGVSVSALNFAHFSRVRWRFCCVNFCASSSER